MEEPWLSELSNIPGVGQERARALYAAGFRTLEEIDAASLDSLARVTGIGELLAKKIKGLARRRLKERKIDGQRYREEARLFICPNCGSLVAEGAGKCPKCGVEFEEEEELVEMPLEEKERAVDGYWYKDEAKLFICPNCGSLVAEGAGKCPKCGAQFEEEEELVEMPLEEKERAVDGYWYKDEAKLFICPNCGSLVAEGAGKCPKCGAEFEEEAAVCEKCGARIGPEGRCRCHPPARKEEPRRRGISKDFLDRWSNMKHPEPTGVSKAFAERWKQIAEKVEERPKPPAPELPAEEEIDAFLTMTEEMGEPLSEKEIEEAERQLEHYDLLLEVDPSRDDIWQAKGDLLRRLGRIDDAVRCFDEAIRRSYEQIRAIAQPQEGVGARKGRTNGLVNGLTNGLRAPGRLGPPTKEDVRARGYGLVNGRGRVNGRINGLVNGRGRINGLVNGRGRVNGRINGLVNGRGRVNGRINGLVNGRGRVNGLVNGRGRINGLVNGRGRVNGLINGFGLVNGFINGVGAIGPGLVNGMGLVNGTGIGVQRYGRARPWIFPPPAQSLAILACLLMVMLILPMIVQYTAEAPPGMRIDGYFDDWDGMLAYTTALQKEDVNPDARIDRVMAAMENSTLYLFVEVSGRHFMGTTSPLRNTTSSMYVLVDADANASTGYSAGGIGAEHLVEVQGWRGNRYLSHVKRFKEGEDREDWNSFTGSTGVSVAAIQGAVELSIPLDPGIASPAGKPVFLIGITDGNGTLDIFDVPISPELPVLRIEQMRPSTESVAPGATATAAAIRLRGYGEEVRVEGLRLTFLGTGRYEEDYTLSDIRLSSGTLIPYEIAVDGEECTLSFEQPINISAVGAALNISISVSPSALSGNTIGIGVTGALVAEPAYAHIDGMPDGLLIVGSSLAHRIDGSFAEWDTAVLAPDPPGDVAAAPAWGNSLNANVDIRNSSWAYDQDLFFYAEVSGRMLGGSVFPRYIPRIEAPPYVIITPDSDRDSVSDDLDPMPHDFNNDGIADSESFVEIDGIMYPDVDGNGVPDYPRKTPDGLTDLWLNTTLPLNFSQSPGKFVSVYIGPVAPVVIRDLDTLTIYIDADGDVTTGARPRAQIGAEYALHATGNGGVVHNASIYNFVQGMQGLPWQWICSTEIAAGKTRLEAMVSGEYLPSLTPNCTVQIEISDWNGDCDITDPSAPINSTRAIAGDNVVLNEIASRPDANEWVELCNPTPNPIDISGWRIRVRGLFGGWTTIYTFPAGTIIGAWGSGSEYLVVTDPNGAASAIPNFGGSVRLDDPATGVIIDQVAYPFMAGGQTYARFKNETYGMPTDTDVDANDWYISNNNWIVPEGPTPGAPNDRRRPVISVEKMGNVTAAPPGTEVLFTIYYNNTGDGNAKHVWVNDTLPAGMTYVSSSVPYTSVSGSTYTWYFSNVPPGTHVFTLTALINPSVPYGTVLTNLAELNYTDQLSMLMEYSSDTWNVTVSAPAPSITVSKVADTDVVSPGDIVTYTIYYNNIGNGAAGDVWINDTLPSGITYLSADPPPDSTVGQEQ
ncbi:MAG: helix-hairpin-helix domain-containing protein, partial [Candidatus Thermoplasmatota archaeon]